MSDTTSSSLQQAAARAHSSRIRSSAGKDIYTKSEWLRRRMPAVLKRFNTAKNVGIQETLGIALEMGRKSCASPKALVTDWHPATLIYPVPQATRATPPLVQAASFGPFLQQSQRTVRATPASLWSYSTSESKGSRLSIIATTVPKSSSCSFSGLGGLSRVKFRHL